ncbi:hypothetical protein DTO012A7_5290 [Penicillium roqueforti]|nr:hypothetical protein CBS147354_5762 [Penicillium roqueforti]KAI3113016.1 hypothetical protein CBS147333_3008 [Penicillium roqueforti]KAI3201064.1 hypothetical protein CBS147311_5125 [Penicillium roqueforti]KAI3231679.1 hypothetical protein DTO012A7_5290 [Penicillium roqueforti]KAI3271631.1 hypothetical protein CBS147308_4311 [Penicillium roqueforti]
MPITLTTAAHCPRKWETPKVSTAEELFKRSCPKDHERSRKLIQSSFQPSLFRTSHVSASRHGFVWAVFLAYSDHHNLIIRPEDVWFSILTQLSFFVNAHAEELRSFFVSHEGQKALEVIEVGTIHSADFGALALRMTRLIEKSVVDEELRTWIMPDFSTSTESDNVVAAILMMGALQKYFSFKVSLTCGIPSVTLLGERKDWENIVKKLEKLYQLGDEPARFAQLLRPILNHFVASFDTPNSPDVLSFWSRCAHKHSMGSGPDYLCGWVSAFCFWGEDGKLLCAESIHSSSSPNFQTQNTEWGLDAVLSRRIDTDDVPSGFASVPVTIDDNGVVYDAVMLAGLIGIQATSSGAMLDGTRDHNDSGVFQYNASGQLEPIVYSISPPTEEAALDSIQPLSGWWIHEKKRAKETEDRTVEKKELRTTDRALGALDAVALRKFTRIGSWKRSPDLKNLAF